MGRTAERLDGFTDAAFAFALTLLVIGGNEAPTSHEALAAAVAELPTFAIGFAFIAMFWAAHVRWRNFRGEGGWLGVLLSLLLVFFVLIYIQPLRAMARSLSHYLGGGGPPFVGGLGDLFLVYGAGFSAMAGVTMILFAEAQRAAEIEPQRRRAARGEMFIWMTLLVTGLVSILLAAFEATENLAPWVYATLPLSIGLFAARFDWDGSRPKETEDD